MIGSEPEGSALDTDCRTDEVDNLYVHPRVLVSHPDFGYSLTIANAASGHYALRVITIVAAIFAPLILLYQGWTYHVFRRRLGAPRVGDSASG